MFSLVKHRVSSVLQGIPTNKTIVIRENSYSKRLVLFRVIRTGRRRRNDYVSRDDNIVVRCCIKCVGRARACSATVILFAHYFKLFFYDFIFIIRVRGTSSPSFRLRRVIIKIIHIYIYSIPFVRVQDRTVSRKRCRVKV